MDALARELDDLLRSEGDRQGLIPTGIPSLAVFQANACTIPAKVLYKPLLCVVVQGAKRIRLGDIDYDFQAGQSLVVDLDLPLQSTIVSGSGERPYRALSLELDPALFQEVSSHMPHPPLPRDRPGPALSVQDLEPVVGESLLRLVRIARNPQAVSVLAPSMLRELVFHLLSGPNGSDFARLAFPTGHTRLVVEAVRTIRQNLASTLKIPALAASVGMSSSSFHQRFKEMTASTPRQFQKQLRLHEARRLMLSDGCTASEASSRVGYRSESQFSREYSRHFGTPPRRDVVGSRSLSRT